MLRNAPGSVRDSIVEFLSTTTSASIHDIQEAVESRIGNVSASSVRSYLNLNVPGVFERVGRGTYRLTGQVSQPTADVSDIPIFRHGLATLYHADCFDWLREQPSQSVHEPPRVPWRLVGLS